jgi:hypothetical protein
LKLIERFRRADEDTLIYQFTVDDPATWEKTWTAEIPAVKSRGTLFEYACHEGNYGMAGVLSGARAAERAQAKDQKIEERKVPLLKADCSRLTARGQPNRSIPVAATGRARSFNGETKSTRDARHGGVDWRQGRRVCAPNRDQHA